MSSSAGVSDRGVVIDIGVMVPWQDILQSAYDNQADMIGLSGMITPYLD